MIGGSFLEFWIDSQDGICQLNLAKGIKIQLLLPIKQKSGKKKPSLR
jgi:hypothetical protein